MRELDKLDARYGLGADPRQYPRVRRERPPAPKWVTALGAVSCLVFVTVILAFMPGPMRYQVRHLLHLTDDRLVPIVETNAEGTYAFEHTQPGSDTPVSYNPCDPIRYVVNPDGGPSDGLDTIRAAVDEASRRSGFEFQYEGTTDDRRFERDGGPVLIGFARSGELDDLPENGDVVGLGGSTMLTDGTGYRRYVTGMVALKASFFRQADAQGLHDEEEAVVLHELGHVLGLDHVDDPGQLMFPSVTRTDYGPGDLEGLAELGAVPCS
jgi:hypothetical protein